jgi:2-phospho-L-lactate/phosphoenolpyruvate guanylyltransferase
MIRWRALVPIKQGDDSKSRLAASFSPEAREALSLQMAHHVLAVLSTCDRIETLAILSARRPIWWQGAWVADHGEGLNEAFAAWRERQGDAAVMIIHADLPLLRIDEVNHLLDCASEDGIAMATDRAGEGSNAVAIADGRAFTFRFGPNSRSLHAAQYPEMTVLHAVGLSADIDTPEDAQFASARLPERRT